MKKIYSVIPPIVLTFLLTLLCAEKKFIVRNDNFSPAAGHTVYIVNSNLHTGIIIPVDQEAEKTINAVKFFRSYKFIDIGWGEEKYYQEPVDSLLMGARAILLPNTSVIRVEGYSGTLEDFIMWSDYAVELTLTGEQYNSLLEFIAESFMKDNGGEDIMTSAKRSGRVIFFRSVYRYHLFHTCNTWVAEALEYSGLNVSPSLVITAGQLYDEIKEQGRVIREPR